MVYVPNAQEFLPSARGRCHTPTSNSPASKPGILRRIVQAMFEWRKHRRTGKAPPFLPDQQVDCRQRIRAGDLPAFSDGIRCTAVTAELMEHYRRQAHVMQNAGPVAVADLIEHYRRQAHAMRSAEMGTAILQVAHWLLSDLRRRLGRARSTK